MGVVWQALDERLHRTVAVKQLLPQAGVSAAQAEEARLRSMREGRIAARLQHPNAITVYDVVDDEGQPWLVMEYLPSRSLAAELDDRMTLPPQEAARIGAEVATALVAAHAAGIVHRDIKPANVLLGEDGSVKITDFGISRAVGDVTVTATGMLAGTPAYLAPEVAKGMEPTPASDVFSLGSTLYICVEGHSPFGLSENTLALLHAVAAGKISPPRQAGPLTALLMRLLRTDPAERPTMTAAKEALTHIAAGRPVPPGLLTGTYDGPTMATRAPSVPTAIPLPSPGTPPKGHQVTRLDANPLADPRRTPPGGFGPPQSTGSGAPVGPPGGPVGPAGRGHAQDPKPSPDVKKIVLTVLAIIGAALVGVLVASLFTTGNKTDAETPSTSSTQPTVTVTSTTSSTPKPSSSTKSTSSSSSSSSSSASDTNFDGGDDFVKQYYSLLPGNPEAAWALLTPKAQAKSKGKKAFFDFYARFSEVKFSGANQNGNVVTGTVKFTPNDGGKQDSEPYRFVLVKQGGNFLIDDFDQTGNP
jgi:serine/threonine protein kinase